MSRPGALALLRPMRAELCRSAPRSMRMRATPTATTAIAARRSFRAQAPLRGLREVYGPEPARPENLYDPLAMRRWEEARVQYWGRRQRVAMAGALFCMVSALLATMMLQQKPAQNEARDRGDGISGTAATSTSVVDRHLGLRATGTDSVPWFPRTLRLPISAASSGRSTTGPTAALPAGTALAGEDNTEELTLLGLGIRTVSFLRIQVYVVGLYVATADLAALQARLVRAGASVEGASTLVGPEVDALRGKLTDPVAGGALWDQILREDGVRSVIRVVPTRKTDYSHLRDGWMTGIRARSKSLMAQALSEKDKEPERFDDDAFGEATRQFQAMFGARKSLGKGRVMLLEREAHGRLVAWEEANDPGRPRTDPTKVATPRLERMGAVDDERISRLIWLGYLAGASVSSEPARQDIIEGIMELATRPVGTVETQVI